MPERSIEIYIEEILSGDARKNALDFFAYLKANEMQFERGKGYWEDKFYWVIKYNGESVCYILINNHENTEPWIIWSDDSDSNWYAEAPLDEHMKEIAWRNVDICGNCGGCDKPGGRRKTVFGKDFENVCITTMRFDNPDAEAVECMKRLVEIRKNDILKKVVEIR
jgi:hypothetical protein